MDDDDRAHFVSAAGDVSPPRSLHRTVSVRASRPFGTIAPCAMDLSTSSSCSSSMRATRSGAMTRSTSSTESHEVHDRKESSHVTDDGGGFSLTSSLSTPHAASWTLPPTRAPSHSHTSPRGTRLRSDAMDTPRLTSSFSTLWPTPGNALTGKGSTTRAACDAGSTV